MNRYAAGWRFVPYPSSRSGLVRALARLARADILIRVGGPLPHSSLMALARLRGVPVVIIWAGTDVLGLLRNPSLLNESQKCEVIHLAVAPWLVDELNAAGIRARYLPIIGVEGTADAPSSPRQPYVLTYLPEPRREFYGRDFVYEVARGLPDMRFLAVGAGEQDAEAPPNVRYLGWRGNLNELYDQAFAILRVPKHDGMSLVVLEALARGKFVIWKYSLPGVNTVSNPKEALACLRALWDRQQREPGRHNIEGMTFIQKHYEAGRVARGLGEFLDATLQEYASRRQKRTVAIVGHDLFCAEVARLTNDLPMVWQANVLHFETKIEHLSSLLQLARADVLYSIGQPVLGRTVGAVTRLLKKPRVVHWVGSDIRLLEQQPQLRRDLGGARVAHVAEIEWEVEELRPQGIEAAIAPLPPRLSNGPVLPTLPEVFTILAYLPRQRAAFYGGREVELLMGDFLDKPVRFIIVGGALVDAPPGAFVENLGWTHALAEVYARSTVLVRFTSNDGLALMVLEALAMGRHVLWTKSFPFVRKVTTYDELKGGVADLFERHCAGQLTPQWEASQYIRTGYDPAMCLQGLVARWEAAARPRRKRQF
jgi:glycosyltransferase involved in cell wall biosynthesis